MIHFNFPAYLVQIISTFCSNRRFYVQIGQSRSSNKTTKYGTPQGSSVSPILYAIFIADIKLQKDITTALFADDTTFLAFSIQHRGIATRLRKAYKNITRYCERWKINLNALKTEAILFPIDQKRKRRPCNNSVTLNPLPIPESDEDADEPINDNTITYAKSVKYLGITFDSKLLFAEHINKAVTRASAITAMLYPLFARSSKLTQRTKLLLYKSIVRPIMTYGSPVWTSAAKTHQKRLQIVQNRALKTILGVNRRHPTLDVHQRADIPTIAEFLVKIDSAFYQRCQNSIHPLIRGLAP